MLLPIMLEFLPGLSKAGEETGEKNVMKCGVVQYLILWGTMVGYTVTAAMSMMAIKRSDCFHAEGLDAPCETSGIFYVIFFGVMEVISSQFSNLEKKFVSIVHYTAAAMSFAYSFIGLYLCVVQLVLHHEVKGNLLGVKIDSISPHQQRFGMQSKLLETLLLPTPMPCFS